MIDMKKVEFEYPETKNKYRLEIFRSIIEVYKNDKLVAVTSFARVARGETITIVKQEKESDLE